MKKLVLGLMLAAVAVGGSAFTTPKKSIVENFLIQPLTGIFLRVTTANGGCINLLSTLQCRYAVTSAGRLYIPAQAWYTNEDIISFLNAGYIEEMQVTANGIYLII